MSFILKNIVTNKKINFWNFINFFKVGVGEGVVFYYIKDFKQLLPSKPRTILKFIKDRVANLTPLKKIFKNIIK